MGEVKGIKFKLVSSDKITFGGEVLHRIKALKDFRNVREGDLGGYLSRGTNLSQEDTCWVYENAKVLSALLNVVVT